MAAIVLRERKPGAQARLAARSPLCRDLIMHKSILGACDKFLKPFCDRYQLHLTQTIAIGPDKANNPCTATASPGVDTCRARSNRN